MKTMNVLNKKASKPGRTFAEELTRLKSNKDRLALPRPSLAMWPDDVEFWTDISDPSTYNEQYIETHFLAESIVSNAYLASTWHSVTLIATIAGCISIHRISFLVLIGEFFALGLLSLFFLAIKMPGGRTRFNRTAQLVHFFHGRKLLTIPWRDAYPFAQIVQLGSVDLDIFFPTIKSTADKTKREIVSVSGNFDVGEASLCSAFFRLEFIRRYMEEGLAAIAPSALSESGRETRRASGQFQKKFDIFYYLGFGFLIDRWAAYCNARFRWPEEVERLCGPDADLTGHDIAPVVTSKTQFYRFDIGQGGYYICDALGNALRNATLAERTATNPAHVNG